MCVSAGANGRRTMLNIHAQQRPGEGMGKLMLCINCGGKDQERERCARR